MEQKERVVPFWTGGTNRIVIHYTQELNLIVIGSYWNFKKGIWYVVAQKENKNNTNACI